VVKAQLSAGEVEFAHRSLQIVQGVSVEATEDGDRATTRRTGRGPDPRFYRIREGNSLVCMATRITNCRMHYLYNKTHTQYCLYRFRAHGDPAGGGLRAEYSQYAGQRGQGSEMLQTWRTMLGASAVAQ
jgi:hypothetical protein